MAGSSLLGVETAGLLLAALFVGWGGADVVRALAAGAAADRVRSGAPRADRVQGSTLAPLGVLGIVASGLVAAAYEGPGPEGTVAGMFLVGFGTLVGLEFIERHLEQGGEANSTEAGVGAASPGAAVPRFPGTVGLAVALPLLELVVGFVVSGGNAPALAGIALGAAVGSLGVRGIRAPGPPPAADDGGEVRGAHAAANVYLWSSSALVGSVLIAYASQDVRELFAGALLLPVLCGAGAGLGARIGYAAWGTDEGHPPQSTLVVRVVATAVPSAFSLYTIDWALQVGRPWALFAGILGVLAASAIGLLVSPVAPRRARGQVGSPPAGERIGASRDGSVLVGLGLTALAAGVAFEVGGFQGEWGGVFVPDLGLFCLGLFGVAALAVLPEIGIADTLAARPRSAYPRTPGLGDRVALVAFFPALVTAGAAFLVAAPIENGVATGTFWTGLGLSNPAVLAGLGCGAVAAVVSTFPFRWLGGRAAVGAGLGRYGAGALVTATSGVALGPAGWFGALVAFGLVGSISFSVGRRAEGWTKAPAASWGTAFPVDLMLGAWTGVGFAAVSFHHGWMVPP